MKLQLALFCVQFKSSVNNFIFLCDSFANKNYPEIKVAKSVPMQNVTTCEHIVAGALTIRDDLLLGVDLANIAFKTEQWVLRANCGNLNSIFIFEFDYFFLFTNHFSSVTRLTLDAIAIGISDQFPIRVHFE